MDYSEISRDEAFDKLLIPITWVLSSRIIDRKDLVNSRHKEVRLVYPFLTDEEKKRADEWFESESHSALWD